MKVIDLLNKIANNEKVPDAIKWGCHDFKWNVDEYRTINEFEELTLFDYLSECPGLLNEEIITFNKIEEKKIPEKIPYQFSLDYIYCNINETAKEEINKTINDIYDKINEIIDYLKSKGE